MPTSSRFRKPRREVGHRISISARSRSGGRRAGSPTAPSVRRRGEHLARYDKIHLFDVDLPNGESWRESRTYTGAATKR